MAPTLREEQVNTLLRCCPNISVVSPGAVFDQPLQPMGVATPVTLRVTLPPTFPQDPPVLQIYPPTFFNPFIEPTGRVHPGIHPSLGRWGPRSSLGKVISEVVQLLTYNSAKQAPQVSHGSSASIHTLSAPSIPNVQNTYVSLPQRSNHSSPQLPAKPAFPELESLSAERMQMLLDSEQAFNDFFLELEAVRSLESVKMQTAKLNKEIAASNIEKEQRLLALQAELEGKQQRLASLRLEYDELSTKQAALLKQFTAESLIQKLSAAVDDAEKEADAVIEQYEDGGMDHQEFIKEFTEKRKLYHHRLAKKESLQTHYGH